MNLLSLPKIALIGRPNVGKSTLFNRLTQRHTKAIVHDQPGVTRDRRDAKASLSDLEFLLIDTAGLENSHILKTDLQQKMRQQTEYALNHCDVVLFMIDIRDGLTPLDQDLAKWVRKKNKPVILVANKCESLKLLDDHVDLLHRLGFGEPLPFSAAHGQGLALLYQALKSYIPSCEEQEDSPLSPPVPSSDLPLKVTIVGRPNVGKSTLLNKLLGEERMITGDLAGITRDAITVDWDYKGRAIQLVDTAGIRRRSRVIESVEQLSVTDSFKAINFSEIVILMIEATTLFEKQDLAIAEQVIEEGRGLVIAVNKMDTVPNTPVLLKEIQRQLRYVLPRAKGVPVVPISAHTGRNLDRLFDDILVIDGLWNKQFSTGALNRWLQKAINFHPPARYRGRVLNFKYITQTKTRPPTFALFVNMIQGVTPGYLHYLTNSLREAFSLPGIPVRFILRKSHNPYAE